MREVLEWPFFDVGKDFLADDWLLFSEGLDIIIGSNGDKGYFSPLIWVSNRFMMEVRLLSVYTLRYFSPHFFNKKIEIFITVRIVNSKVATSFSRILTAGRCQSLLLSVGVELIGWLINFVCFAVFFRLEDERSLKVTIFLYLSYQVTTLSSMGVAFGCQPSSSYL